MHKTKSILKKFLVHSGGVSRGGSAINRATPSRSYFICFVKYCLGRHFQYISIEFVNCLLPVGLVAQWIRHLTTNQGIVGLSPAKIKIFSYYRVE